MCLIFFIIISSSVSFAQSSDLLYLKNGSIIKGTIVELLPEKTVKIRTADGSVHAYMMSEVEKIVKDEKQVSGKEYPSPQGQKPLGQVLDGNGICMFAGVSVPVGDFGSTSASSGGAANLGFCVGIEGSMELTPGFAWLTSVDLSINSMDLDGLLGGTGLQGDAGSWVLVWAMTGLKFYGNTSSNGQVFGAAQIGLLFGNSPEVTLSSLGVSAVQKSSSATTFAFSMSGGFCIDGVILGLRYMVSEPEYDLMASSGLVSATTVYKQPTAVLQLTLGLLF